MWIAETEPALLFVRIPSSAVLPSSMARGNFCWCLWGVCWPGVTLLPRHAPAVWYSPVSLALGTCILLPALLVSAFSAFTRCQIFSYEKIRRQLLFFHRAGLAGLWQHQFLPWHLLVCSLQPALARLSRLLPMFSLCCWKGACFQANSCLLKTRQRWLC